MSLRNFMLLKCVDIHKQISIFHAF